jgi:hypothetical protein
LYAVKTWVTCIQHSGLYSIVILTSDVEIKRQVVIE